MSQALDSFDEREQRRLAREATRLDPDCSSAWSLLGDLAPDDRRALPHYQKAVAAIDREVGEELCRQLEAGRGSIDDAHPWYVGRCDLAYALLGVGRIEETIELLNILLRLVPEDEAGLRFLLARALFRDHRDEELTRLMNRYDNTEECACKYIRSLLLYRMKGDSRKARDALVEAYGVNHHVVDYLMNPDSLPDELPDDDEIDPGSRAEAASYVLSFLDDWEQTNGAMDWLCEVIDEVDPIGPDDLLDALLTGNEQLGEVFDPGFVEPPQLHWRELLPRVNLLPPAMHPDWSIDLVRISEDNAEDENEWVVAIVDGSSRLPLMLQPFRQRPRDTEVFDVLMKAIFEPTTGRAARPASIRMKRKGFFKAWQKRLERVDIRCELVDELPEIDRTISLLIEGARVRAASRTLGDVDDDQLLALPQRDTTWVAIVRPLPAWVRADDRMVRPWVRLIANATNPAILSSDMIDTPPWSDWLREGLAVAMQVADDAPCRPRSVVIEPPEFAEELRPWLESLEVECIPEDNPEALDRLVENFADQITGPGRAPALVKTTGVTTEMVAALYQAAWAYYLLKPWENISEDTTLKVECDAWDSGPWYANLVGSRGIKRALTLYEDREFVEDLNAGRLSHEETTRKISSLALTFSTMYDLSPDDVDIADEQEWPVADPHAWPNVIRVNPGMSRRSALPWELELLIACLLAFPTAITEDGVRSDWQYVETVGRKVGIRISVAGE
ncbi:hypothetical protein [Maioricimonas sp. JC845]|uniref:DUF6930 domain-containing protein n=1 Tax=Maioricimonas sp. JC845 TaxID=3232138 RepID=UPI003459444C